jgi:hypothetical protein
MMGWCVQLEVGKRQNLSNCLGGKQSQAHHLLNRADVS